MEQKYPKAHAKRTKSLNHSVPNFVSHNTEYRFNGISKRHTSIMESGV